MVRLIKKKTAIKSVYREERISEAIENSAIAILSLRNQVRCIQKACGMITACLRSGKKVLTAGNGGSAAEAQHMSEELVGRFRGNRISLPAVSLAADPTALTCIGNDFGFDYIFSRQVEGLGSKGDVLVLFSTSGKAANLRNALVAAKLKGVKTLAILGRDGGPMAGKADHEIIVPCDATERVQEAHQLLLHIILDAVEEAFS